MKSNDVKITMWSHCRERKRRIVRWVDVTNTRYTFRWHLNYRWLVSSIAIHHISKITKNHERIDEDHMSAKGHVHKNMFLRRSWLQHQLNQWVYCLRESAGTAQHHWRWPCKSWSIQEEGRQGSSSVRALFSEGSTRRPATNLCAHVFGSSSQRSKTSRLHGSDDRSLVICSWRDDLRSWDPPSSHHAMEHMTCRNRETRSWAPREAVVGNLPDASLADDARLSFLDAQLTQYRGSFFPSLLGVCPLVFDARARWPIFTLMCWTHMCGTAQAVLSSVSSVKLMTVLESWIRRKPQSTSCSVFWMAGMHPSKCLPSGPGVRSRIRIWPVKSVCLPRTAESSVSSSPYSAGSWTFTVTCLEIRTITRVCGRAQSESSSLVSREETLQSSALSRRSNSSGLIGCGEATMAETIGSPSVTRGLPRTRWSEAQKRVKRRPFVYKVQHSRGLRQFSFRRVINKHVKVVERFWDRECKPFVARTVASNLFRRLYSVAWPHGRRTRQGWLSVFCS